MTDNKVLILFSEIKGPSILQRVFHNSRVSNSVYYISHAKSVDPTDIRDVLTESTPYKYPQELEQFSFKVVQKEWTKKVGRKELNMKYNEKTNTRSRQTQDLLKRLYVEDPPWIEGLKTIFDVDPNFFSIVEGRPIQKKFSMSAYLEVRIFLD